MQKMRKMALGLALSVSAVAMSPTTSGAAPGDPGDPRTDITSGYRDSNGVAHINGGLYVVGDSISRRPTTATAPPYGIIAASELRNGQSVVRAVDGATADTHLNSTWWPNGKKTFADAEQSDASTVFVLLGTNDMSCLHRNEPAILGGGICRQAFYPGDPGITPSEPSPAYTRWREERLKKVFDTTMSGIKLLTDAGKCVIWAGPREVDIYGTRKAEWAFYNDFLQAHAGPKGSKGGKLVYADFDAYARNQPDLAADFKPKWNGAVDVHQTTAKSSVAIARFAVFYARFGCGMAPRVGA